MSNNNVLNHRRPRAPAPMQTQQLQQQYYQQQQQQRHPLTPAGHDDAADREAMIRNRSSNLTQPHSINGNNNSNRNLNNNNKARSSNSIHSNNTNREEEDEDTEDNTTTQKKTTCGRLAAFSYLHTAVTLLYLVLFALSLASLIVRHYASPVITISNVYQQHFTNAHITIAALVMDVPLDQYTDGGNVTLNFVIDLWSIVMDLNITVPYLPARNQLIHQRYTVEDLPCKELRGIMRSEQVCLLLATFLFFMLLLLSISQFFSRVLLPVMWVLGWVCVAMSSAACCLSIRLLTRQSCKDTTWAFPAYKDLAVPQVGFAFLLVCMIANLITVVLTVFL